MKIESVTVVGANGTMGRNIAAIFASFGNATVYLVSRSKEKSIEAKNKAYTSVRAESIRGKMIPSDYEHLGECILKSDLVFEACAENFEIKKGIHSIIAKAIAEVNNTQSKVICSGTSGLSIAKLAELYPMENRHQIMGMHMFNPPYQMTLCEMTPTKYTKMNNELFSSTMNYVRNILHRTVAETADFPAFLGNRIGFQAINEALLLAEKYKYNGGIDYIDAIMGPFTGRSMPLLVTANFVGLDVHAAIIENLYFNTNDYAHETFFTPSFLNVLIEEGKIGRKVGEGLYKTILHDSGVKIHQVYDIAHNYYRGKMQYIFPFVEEMIKNLHVGDYSEALKVLIENESQEAELCCVLLLKYVIYSLNTAKLLGCSMEAADDVMATGFHWCPPLAVIDAFSEICDFESLCEQKLSERIINEIHEKKLFKDIKKSKYDYRRFIIAKR